MEVSTSNFHEAAAGPRRKKNIALIVVGTINVMGGALIAAAPHLMTLISPQAFAVTMIVTGLVVAALTFVRTQLDSEEE